MIEEDYRVRNARITNSKNNPNGFLYILKIDNLNLYKIGVSNNPKRRIRDIQSYLPFESKVVFIEKYKEVYDLELKLHKIYSENKLRKEWFNIIETDFNHLKSILEDIHSKELIK